jgi:hypothetical protein
MKKTVLALTMVFTLIGIAIASMAHAQGQTFAPAKGQSAEQQSKDSAECQAIAVQQSGFDPAKAAVGPPPPAAGGQRAKGAARGAAVGAAAGAIGGDAGKGAAAGAAAGTVAGGMKKRQEAREQTAQAQQQQASAAQGQAGYDKSLAGCMQGKGYTVK